MLERINAFGTQAVSGLSGCIKTHPDDIQVSRSDFYRGSTCLRDALSVELPLLVQPVSKRIGLLNVNRSSTRL